MLQSFNPGTGRARGEPWADSTSREIDAAVQTAASAAPSFGSTPASTRAKLLRALADGLQANAADLVPLADSETALGLPRLEGELARTVYQLRGFAEVLEHGAAHPMLDEPAVPGTPPVGRPHLTRVKVPIGPVAMFSASNFPFAFSVAGGDTASALAAGCPVVVKGHPAHPELSLAVAAIAAKAVAGSGLPEGVFQFVQGAGVDVGVRLVQAPGIAAVAFTGSFRGGMALARLASERPRPIPFYGELGSINPLVVLPAALEEAGAALAVTLAGSICAGSGQFCTSPGVIIVWKDQPGDAFVQALADALTTQRLHPMLTPGIREGFERGVVAWREHAQVKVLVDEGQSRPEEPPHPCLAQVSAADFMADAGLHEEVFGSAALVVRVSDEEEAAAVLKAIGGALTVTLWGVPQDSDAPDSATLAIVRTASQIAGRVLFAGVPTGVAVTAAQVHGGPFPASTAPFSTSVGYAALERFLRPVVLQDAPAWLLCRNGVAV